MRRSFTHAAGLALLASLGTAWPVAATPGGHVPRSPSAPPPGDDEDSDDPHARAERDDYRRHNLRTNALGDVLGAPNLFYEGAFARHVTASLGGQYIAPAVFPFSGVGGELALHFWTRRAHDGFFVGPFFQLGTTFDDPPVQGVASWAIGARLGWRWNWDGFNIGLGAGVAYLSPFESICDDCVQLGPSKPGANPVLLLDIGYSFGGRRPSTRIRYHDRDAGLPAEKYSAPPPAPRHTAASGR